MSSPQSCPVTTQTLLIRTLFFPRRIRAFAPFNCLPQSAPPWSLVDTVEALGASHDNTGEHQWLWDMDGDTQGKNPTVLLWRCPHQLSPPKAERGPSASVLSLPSGLLVHGYACYLPLLDADPRTAHTNATDQLTVANLHPRWKGRRAEVPWPSWNFIQNLVCIFRETCIC